MLKVEGLNAGYGSVNILWDIGFEVKDGEIVAILGSNGAGKTTMVRTITGMVKASSGKVEFNGEDLSGKSSRVILDSGIVQVPEGRQLFTEMTVLENLELGAFNKETKAHFAENLEKCYNWFPKLRERAKQAAGTLSGGEQQMVAVARALIGMPKLLILDEPTNGLDPAGIQEMRSLISSMPETTGATVLISNHLLGEIEQMVTQVGILNHGKMLFEGSLQALQKHSRGGILLRVLDVPKSIAVLNRQGIRAVTQAQHPDVLELPALPDEALAALVSTLAENGVGVVGLTAQTKNLEEIFLSLTQTSGEVA